MAELIAGYVKDRQNMYRYFMVFKNRDFDIDGAYTLDEFIEVMKNL